MIAARRDPDSLRLDLYQSFPVALIGEEDGP